MDRTTRAQLVHDLQTALTSSGIVAAGRIDDALIALGQFAGAHPGDEPLAALLEIARSDDRGAVDVILRYWRRGRFRKNMGHTEVACRALATMDHPAAGEAFVLMSRAPQVQRNKHVLNEIEFWASDRERRVGQ